MAPRPIIIAHRGACGALPEHTIEAFRLAIEQGADAIETDVVMSGDGQLICRHDCELSQTTNVATLPNFSSRKTTRRIEGIEVEGWFSSDFQAEEILTLRARQRFPFRDHSFDDRFPVVSLDDLLRFAVGQRTRNGGPVGVVIELKHPTYFASVGLPMLPPLVALLARHSLMGANAPVYVESFEIQILQDLRSQISTPIIQLLDAPHLKPADRLSMEQNLTFGQMSTPAGLVHIASYASAIGAWKQLIVPAIPAVTSHRSQEPEGPPATTLIADAHAAGLAVHAWTFRSEPRFLSGQYESDPAREYLQFASLGLDGFITDHCADAVACLRKEVAP